MLYLPSTPAQDTLVPDISTGSSCSCAACQFGGDGEVSKTLTVEKTSFLLIFQTWASVEPSSGFSSDSLGAKKSVGSVCTRICQLPRTERTASARGGPSFQNFTSLFFLASTTSLGRHLFLRSYSFLSSQFSRLVDIHTHCYRHHFTPLRFS